MRRDSSDSFATAVSEVQVGIPSTVDGNLNSGSKSAELDNEDDLYGKETINGGADVMDIGNKGAKEAAAVSKDSSSVPSGNAAGGPPNTAASSAPDTKPESESWPAQVGGSSAGGWEKTTGWKPDDHEYK